MHQWPAQSDVPRLTFKRDIRLSHLRDLLLRFVHSRVPPPAQMEPETPRRLPRRKADKGAVLLDHLLWARAGEEVEVKSSADLAIFDQRDVGRGRRKKQDVGARCAAEGK